MNENIQGKVIVITGASSGLGEAAARLLAAQGAPVVLGARRQDRIQALARELTAGGGKAIAVMTDVTDRTQVQRLVDAAVEAFGRIDVMINNAGLMPQSRLERLRIDEWDRTIDVNLKGTLYAVRAALPHMRGRAGDIVTVASEAGRRGLPYEAVYCASKFGQVGFTRALDHELREQGIRCTNVCPGGVATDFALEAGRGRSPDALPGMMTAEDVAAVVVFVLERPRHLRILETALRPVTEASWG